MLYQPRTKYFQNVSREEFNDAVLENVADYFDEDGMIKGKFQDTWSKPEDWTRCSSYDIFPNETGWKKV